MMKYLLWLCLLLAFVDANAQASDSDICRGITDTLTNRCVYRIAEVMPAVEGGYEELYKNIASKLTLPNSDQCKESFKIMVAFIVDENSHVSGERLVRDINCKEITDQVFKTIKTHKWLPGMCNGKVVSVIMILASSIDLG